MTTETVTADQLSVGDKVLAFGLQWTIGDNGDTNFALLKPSAPDFLHTYIPKLGATFERIIPPKRYKRTEVLEYREPMTADRFRKTEEVESPDGIVYYGHNTAYKGVKGCVITSVEVEELP